MWPHAGNTGVLTKFTPCCDADLLDTDAARAVEELVRDGPQLYSGTPRPGGSAAGDRDAVRRGLRLGCVPRSCASPSDADNEQGIAMTRLGLRLGGRAGSRHRSVAPAALASVRRRSF
jgi:hypothetical protein